MGAASSSGEVANFAMRKIPLCWVFQPKYEKAETGVAGQFGVLKLVWRVPLESLKYPY
jgi:hypothetical protein